MTVTVGGKTALTAFFVVKTSSYYNALLGRDWIHTAWCVPSTLHQCLIFWKEDEDEPEIVEADKKPFLLESHIAEAQYYDFDLAPLKF